MLLYDDDMCWDPAENEMVHRNGFPLINTFVIVIDMASL